MRCPGIVRALPQTEGFMYSNIHCSRCHNYLNYFCPQHAFKYFESEEATIYKHSRNSHQKCQHVDILGGRGRLHCLKILIFLWSFAGWFLVWIKNGTIIALIYKKLAEIGVGPVHINPGSCELANGPLFVLVELLPGTKTHSVTWFWYLCTFISSPERTRVWLFVAIHDGVGNKFQLICYPCSVLPG